MGVAKKLLLHYIDYADTLNDGRLRAAIYRCPGGVDLLSTLMQNKAILLQQEMED